MKKLHLLPITILGILVIFFFSSVYAEDCSQEELSNAIWYRKFECQVDTICKKWDWYAQKSNLIKVVKIPYPKIEQFYEKNGLKQLKTTISSLGSEFTLAFGSADESGTEDITPDLVFRVSSGVYKETMNSIYRCAILNTKLNIGNSIIKIVKNPDASAVTKKVKEDAKRIAELMTDYGCRNISTASNKVSTDTKSPEWELSAGPEPSIKKELLDNTTYQYCTYRYYLSYLRDQYENNLPVFIKWTEYKNKAEVQAKLDKEKSGFDKFFNNMSTAEKMAAYIVSNTSQVDQEITKIRQTYKTALIAYGEFERTYGIHILLTFIYEDYRMLRDNLRSMLNPIGQVIYKIQNAQSPGS